MLLAAIGFGNSYDTKAAEVEQKPNEITITLHKKGFESLPEGRPNSGLVSNEFGEENISGVDFELFDVTTVYYDLLNDNPTTAEENDGMTSAEAIEWMQQRTMEEWVQDYQLSSIDQQTTNASGEAVFSNVQVSETASPARDKVYLFLETYSPAQISKVAAPMIVMMPVMMPEMTDGTWDGTTWKDTFNTDVHLYPKNETREADKAMNVAAEELKEVVLINEDGTQETISYVDLEKGKEVSYTITAPIPYFIDSTNVDQSPVIRNFQITDTPTEGLTFYDQAITVNVGNTELIEGDDYSVAQAGNGFTVTILTEVNGIANTQTLNKLASGRGGNLTITYNMLVTATIQADEFHNNTASIMIGRNDTYDYDETVVPEEKVATGGRKFEKYDASSSQQLAGAQFELWNEDQTEFAVFYKEGTPLAVYETGADSVIWTNTGQATTFTSDTQGKFEVQGLAYGTYQMKEVAAPEGYVLPAGAAAFTEFAVFYGSYDESVSVSGQTNPGEEGIPNMKKGFLPSTGGNGIFAFLLIGLSLMIGAYSWYKKSKATE